MILTGPEIVFHKGKGDIKIEPFDITCVNPNSYDVHLGRYLLRLDPNYVIDLLSPPQVDAACWEKIDIQNKSAVLEPGVLYLGSTLERCGSAEYAPMYEGRSSTGRVGIVSHLSAGFGDIGFTSHWTLEIMVSNRTKIPSIKHHGHLKIGQVGFFKIDKEATIEAVSKNSGCEAWNASYYWNQMKYNHTGQYANQPGPTPAKKVYK